MLDYLDDPENKDPWPDPPVRVSTRHPLDQWADHPRAFDPLGSGQAGPAPTVTIVGAPG